MDIFITNEDYEPVFGKNYFYKDEIPHDSFQKMSILIPMYNETTQEYKRTLVDLHQCILELNKVGCGYVHILTILDGWSVTHKSMKDYLQIMYPQIANEINSISTSTNEIETYIVQKLDERNEPTWVKISDNMSLKISFIIKKDNRRKHNSHAWFLETFAQEMNSDYIFLTDCGTRFDRKCLLNLFLGISKDNNCSAISGRQRVMTSEQQGTSDNLEVSCIGQCSATIMNHPLQVMWVLLVYLACCLLSQVLVACIDYQQYAIEKHEINF
jgi:cellulose synthase/poly-beta-1,6-N-acetylglucosamine synthase-like glycosyltransferase